MKKPFIILLIAIIFIPVFTFAQSRIVFTAVSGDDSYIFCSVNTDAPFIYENISAHLDSIAPYQGSDSGPIVISHDGNWYSFLSTRFDPDAQGWEALTIVKSDFSEYEAIHDASGNLIHPEGKAMVLNNGDGVVYVTGDGNHARDVFVLQKTDGHWGNPVNITVESPYEYNYFPFVSEDDSTVLFDAGNESFPSTAIGKVNINGTGISFPVTSASLPDGIAVHSPAYDDEMNIIFEGDAAATGERIWKLPHNSSVPELITMGFPDDNSPVTLDNNRIASLWLPESWHQIKIMNSDGSESVLLTDSCALFTEVFDIGLSSAPADPTKITKNKISGNEITVFPNPAEGSFSIRISNKGKTIGTLEIIDNKGIIVAQEKTARDGRSYRFSGLSRGTYFVRYFGGKGEAVKKVIIK